MDLAVCDDKVAPDARIAAAEARHQVVEPAAVDLAHDLPQAGQELLHEVLRPLLQRLAHDSVVGIGHALAYDVPGLVPAQAKLIHKDAHELGDDHGRVRVVDLDDMMPGEAADVAPLFDVLAHDVLRGGGDKEILLLEAEVLAFDVVVRRVEHLGDDLGHGALFQALDILALGEEVHVEGVGAARLPQAEGVDLLAAVTGDQHVARNGDDGGVAGVLGVIAAVGIPVRGDVPAEADLNRVVHLGDKPAVRCDGPVVGDLGLLAVLELLTENAELVADGIAGGLQAERGHAVHIAGGQTAETAVAEAGVRLLFKNIGRAEAEILKRTAKRLTYAEVVGVLHQAAAHQELHGHIMDFLFRMPRILDGEKTAHDLTDHHRRSLEDLVLGRGLAGGGKVSAELIFNGASDFVAGNFCSHIRNYLRGMKYTFSTAIKYNIAYAP